MIKRYKLKHTNLITLLDKAQDFQNVFDTWLLKHNKYSYSVNIEQEKDLWVCNIEIKDEQTENKVSTETISTLGVLQ